MYVVIMKESRHPLTKHHPSAKPINVNVRYQKKPRRQEQEKEGPRKKSGEIDKREGLLIEMGQARRPR